MPLSLINYFKLLPLCWYWSCSDVSHKNSSFNCYNMYFIGCITQYIPKEGWIPMLDGFV